MHNKQEVGIKSGGVLSQRDGQICSTNPCAVCPYSITTEANIVYTDKFINLAVELDPPEWPKKLSTI